MRGGAIVLFASGQLQLVRFSFGQEVSYEAKSCLRMNDQVLFFVVFFFFFFFFFFFAVCLFL